MEVIAIVVIAVVTVLFGLMAIVPLVMDTLPVRRSKPASMSIVIRDDDDREPVRAA